MIYARKCFPNVAIKGQLRSAPKFPRKTALTAKETEEYNLYVTETTTAIKEKNQRGKIILDQYQKGIVFSVKKDEISTIFNEQRRYFSIEQGKEFRFDYSVYVFDLLNAFCEKCLEEKGKERRAAELKRNHFVMKQNGYAFCKRIFEIEEY